MMWAIVLGSVLGGFSLGFALAALLSVSALRGRLESAYQAGLRTRRVREREGRKLKKITRVKEILRGMPYKRRPRVQLNLRTRPEFSDRLARAARERDVPMSTLLEELIENGLAGFESEREAGPTRGVEDKPPRHRTETRG
jgi:hypothetical protein